MTLRYKDQDHVIVMEMAPLDEVPHAIHLFLEQVRHGLWNNTEFYFNGEHVLQAGPLYNRTEEELFLDARHEEQHQYSPEDHHKTASVHYERPSMKAFEELDLSTLSFPDSSDDFPHEPFTVSFAARPGGPDFYMYEIVFFFWVENDCDL